MICTNCTKDDGVDWEPTMLRADQIATVCSNWLCPACLDIAEREPLDMSEGEV